MKISHFIIAFVSAVAGFLLGFWFGKLYLPQYLMLSAFWGAFLAAGGSMLHSILSRRVPKAKARREAGSTSHFLPPQIDSIFLFNTLHNISALASVSPEKASRTVEQLATFIRAASEMYENKTTLLNEEIKIAELYLLIEQARFGPRLKFLKSIDATCLERQVPCFLLLPLVENCVRHGIEVFDREVQIFLTVRRTDERIIVEVSDTGRGVESGNLHEISGENRGLYTVKKNLNLYFGHRADLTIEALAPSGTRVSIILPNTENFA